MVASILQLLGFILFVIPGVYILLGLIFVPTFVAIDDRGIIDSLQESWSLASGHRLELFVLFVIVFVICAIIGFFIGLLNFAATFFGSEPIVALIQSILQFGYAVMYLFLFSTIVQAYLQLQEETAAGS
jgi:membrane-anchored glycerophosphoryl diester phosphodiesterase (GDPDase)